MREQDLDLTRPTIGGEEPHLSGIWEVYEGYEIHTPENGPAYLEAKGTVKKTYRPLVDTPYLFLDFARLANKMNRDRLHEWVEEYGLLGMHYDDGRPYLPVYYPVPTKPPLMYFTEGGPGETTGYYGLATLTAGRVLSLYEAAINNDVDRLRQLFGDDTLKVLSERALHYALAKSSSERLGARADFDDSLREVVVDHALMEVWHVVQDRLSDFTYPTINHELPEVSSVPHFHKSGSLLAPYRLGSSWGFRNLLGAMYLQFYWLITSRADIKRCKNCGRIISLASPISQDGKKGRKPRSDKDYCNKSCQQREDYKRRVKPKRQQNHV